MLEWYGDNRNVPPTPAQWKRIPEWSGTGRTTPPLRVANGTAQTQDDLKPSMNAALSGIAALTAQQQISAKLNNIQKLNDMKAALSPEVYDKMLEQIMNG